MIFYRFLVKSLGKAEAKGLWGIKHTRKPVDEMVTAARSVTNHPTFYLFHRAHRFGNWQHCAAHITVMPGYHIYDRAQ